ncbi:response regulator [Patescibacteria group bacterium]|nr:response regulator [Patescibacteria group bacterium]
MSNKVLIIEDDKTIQQVIKSMLMTEGYEAETADNGEEGLEVMKEFKPDVIMLDIMMPVMSGFDFLKHLKDESIPVIVLTSLGQEIVEKKVRALGAKYFLQKNDIHLDDIKNKITEVLKEESKK